MAAKRSVEIFSAGCPACEEVVTLVNNLACASCEVTVSDMTDPNVAARARQLGVRTVPAVAVDGQLADCCKGPVVEEPALRAAGVGQCLS